MSGNDKKYASVNMTKIPDTILKDKVLFFLGSSVTLGFGSCNDGIPDYISRIYGSTCYKNAINGTTLTDISDDSYVSRLKDFPNVKCDLLILQLSTNDASRNLMLGKSSDDKSQSILGAISYILLYAHDVLKTKVLIYTNSHYDNSNYERMVEALYDLKEKYSFDILDLYSDPIVNSISDDERKLYMKDDIHPTRAGYYSWWLPHFVSKLLEIFKN